MRFSFCCLGWHEWDKIDLLHRDNKGSYVKYYTYRRCRTCGRSQQLNDGCMDSYWSNIWKYELTDALNEDAKLSKKWIIVGKEVHERDSRAAREIANELKRRKELCG